MFGAYGGPEKMKDPRPLHDKAFVQQCIKQLCEVWHYVYIKRILPGSVQHKNNCTNIFLLHVNGLNLA